MHITLDDCPQLLQEAIMAEMAKYNGYVTAKVISCLAHNSMPGQETVYKVYLLYLNTIIIFTYFTTPPIIQRDLVTIGDIKEIMQAEPEIFNYCKN